MILDAHTVLLAVMGAGGSAIGWLLLRAIHGVDGKLEELSDDLRDLGHGQAHHGERIVRLETHARLEPLPPPPRLPRKGTS